LAGLQVWAERYDSDLVDFFALQDQITESVVASIEPHLYAAEGFRSQRKTPESLNAWGLVMGEHLTGASQQSLEEQDALLPGSNQLALAEERSVVRIEYERAKDEALP
jgi:adenylate cyclase